MDRDMESMASRERVEDSMSSKEEGKDSMTFVDNHQYSITSRVGGKDSMTSKKKGKNSMIFRGKDMNYMTFQDRSNKSMTSQDSVLDPVFQTFLSLCRDDYRKNYPEESRNVPAKFIQTACLARWNTMTMQEKLPFINITNQSPFP